MQCKTDILLILVGGSVWPTWLSHQSAKVTQNTSSLKYTGWSNGRKKKVSYAARWSIHCQPCAWTGGEEIGGEGRKWLLKRVSGRAQASFCGAGSGTLLPSFWFQRALGMRCVYLPQLAHFTSNRSQSQHNLLIDAEGRGAESSLSSHWQASISF